MGIRTKLAIVAALAWLVVASAAADAAEPPWLGVVIQNGGGGARVMDVVGGAPADAAGIQANDVIVKVDGRRISSAQSLITTVATLRIGADVDVEIRRGGAVLIVSAKLSRRLTDNEILQRRLLDTEFPEFTMRVLAGTGSGKTSDHRGEVSIYYYLSPGCSGCGAINTALEAIGTEADVSVYAISVAIDTSAAARRSWKAPVGTTLLHDLRAVFRVNHIKSLHGPIVVVTDRKGLVRYAALSGDIDVKDLQFAVSRSLRDELP